MEFRVLAVFWVVWLERIKRILEGRGQMFNGTKLGYITLGFGFFGLPGIPFFCNFCGLESYSYLDIFVYVVCQLDLFCIGCLVFG